MNLFDKAKEATKAYVDDLKEQEANNKAMAESPMEDRIKMRPEGVKYCLINNTGKIMDVYENKVVFTSTHSTSTLVTGAIFGSGIATQGEKTIYYKDAIGVQYKPSSIADGYIQVETSAGGMASANNQYTSENAIQFSGKSRNAEAEIIVKYIKDRIDDIKNSSGGGTVIQQTSAAEELKKFKELLDAGIITQEEFDKKKKELLGF